MTVVLAPDLVLWAIAIGLGFGALVLGLGSLVPATAAKARPLWPTFVTELVIVAAAVLPFVFGGAVLWLCLAALCLRIGHEAGQVALLRCEGASGSVMRRLLPLGLGGLCFGAGMAVDALPLVWSAGLVTLSGLIAAGTLAMMPGGEGRGARIAAELVLFPVLPLVLFVACALTGDNAGLLLLAFLLVETYDSYALLGGKMFGRRPAFPVLSPRKTIEGLAIGGAALALTAALAGPLVLGWPLWLAVLVAALIAVTAVVGDLAGSRLKRASGVKDYPQVLPRQGGVLDIADAWLIAGPALVLLLRLIG
ncbi:phosphatidate cytidylyltransferase [Stappia indica]|uniref:phosphatidate cytidylyltransferase n=1 Tax=Stappia indica TaxID=538381 RepID=UPI001CD1CD6D|nr:phosphatidate cytidylyltransferase [Stappia indica]MCA1298145.1 phosphatidate cytidylyltransferase [Stappia indica]